VHERGQTLSAGERQQLALARAFLARPRVLILDEATSSLDLQSETVIERALDRLLEGRFGDSHRASFDDGSTGRPHRRHRPRRHPRDGYTRGTSGSRRRLRHHVRRVARLGRPRRDSRRRAGPLSHLLDSLDERRRGLPAERDRVHLQVGDAGLPERGDALLHVTRRAAQRREFKNSSGIAASASFFLPLR